MERDITLAELSERHPGVEDDVDECIFVPIEKEEPDIWKKVKAVVRDISIGLVVFLLSVLIGPYVVAMLP
jgi:hypothetical protein